MQARILDAGDTAVTVEFGDGITPELLACVEAFDHAVRTAANEGRLHGLVETVPTFRSLTLIYDPLETSRSEIDTVLAPLLAASEVKTGKLGRLWRLPVCYGGEYGPDLEALALAKGLTPEEVLRIHTETEVKVYMLGFLPGFPFMGDVPETLALPRRTEPRVRVPAGSVAVAGRLTAIYPWESPGGWHLLGRCPVPLFSPAWPSAALLQPGDRVGFYPIDPATFAALDQRWKNDASLPLDYQVVVS